MIGVIGEILVDMIGENVNGERTYTCYAGGAPFNLAVAAHKLRTEVYFMDASVMTRWEASS